MSSHNPRILLVDSYDSFTHNLAALCRQSIPGCAVHIIKNDELLPEELLSNLDLFSAVVVGPGPGSPLSERDIGLIKHIWHVSNERLVPVFGVCLGLQSLAVEFGARLERLKVVKHGQISRIEHEGVELFKGVGEVDAVRYHSLHVQLEKGGEIESLAWADDGITENGRVVMGVKHQTKPYWAVQYHPESVRTLGGGSEVLHNFWRLATTWSTNYGRSIRPWYADADRLFGAPWPQLRLPLSPRLEILPTVKTTRLHLPSLSVPSICEILGVTDEQSPFVLLDSAARPGRFSIIGCLRPSTPSITYFLDDHFVSLQQGKQTSQIDLKSRDIWAWLGSFMRQRRAKGGSNEIPFWGGFIGYLSYELGVHSLAVPVTLPQETKRHPDVSLVFVERSIVVDVVTGHVYVQSLLQDDDAWMANMVRTLRRRASHGRRSDIGTLPSLPEPRLDSSQKSATTISLPDKDLYISRIEYAKERLRSGDSYELCLTAQTKVAVPRQASSVSQGSSSWELYKSLRLANPAPHSAYLRLHPTTILSSSPERFLSFTRPPHTVCQLRPIKGTVRKSPGITRSVAERALRGSCKEVAENLMIVDLIRHDLHGVVGQDVDVRQFCAVEEYETVWQLVSVIEGTFHQAERGADVDEADLGWEALRRCLPPGSMTGAPKKRSVEILQTLEDNQRGIYSGVCGYWCVSGGGDWSVIIRSCFKYDDSYQDSSHEEQVSTEEWTIGAGGAITDLSDPQEEWDEMVLKLQSVLRAFDVKAP